MPIQGDISRMRVVNVGPPKDIGKASYRWWLLDAEDQYKGVFAVVQDILTNLATRRRMNYFFAALYNDTGASFMASRNMNLYYNRTALDGNAMLNSSMSLNVLQNGIDTAMAMIARNHPKPLFVTDGRASYGKRMRGKRLTKFVEGVFDETRMYQIAQRVFLDACIYGTGALMLFEEDGRICARNLFIEELLIDDLEGMHEAPTQIHRRQFRQRDELVGMFPKLETEIRNAEQISGGAATFSTADIVEVVESWHLPSGPKSRDGVHCISINNVTLFSEPYTKDYFPIIFFRWAHQTLGFWGRGIAHEGWKVQREIDMLLQVIQRSMRLVGGPIITCEEGSNVSEEHITSNKIAKVVGYTKTAPQWLTPPTVQGEIFSHINFLIDNFYKQIGVSQQIATGTKDPSLKSAVAQREALDQYSLRFELVGQAWEQFFVEVAKVIVDLAADIGNDNGGLSVLVPSSKGGERIEFAKAKLDIKDYSLQVFPVSGLPSSPAGKMDRLTEWAQAGYLSKEQVMDSQDIPELQEVASLELAAYRRCQEILSDIKEDGQYTPPGAFLNFDLAERMVLLEISRSESEGVEPEHIDMLQRWYTELGELKSAAASQVQGAQQNQAMMGTAAQVGAAAAGVPGQPGTPGAPPEMPPPAQEAA